MGHMKLRQIRRLPDPHAREVQLAYIDGYRLALEDTLSEINQIKSGWKGQAFGPYVQAIKEIRGRVLAILAEAANTDDYLRDKVDREPDSEFSGMHDPEDSSKSGDE